MAGRRSPSFTVRRATLESTVTGRCIARQLLPTIRLAAPQSKLRLEAAAAELNSNWQSEPRNDPNLTDHQQRRPTGFSRFAQA